MKTFTINIFTPDTQALLETVPGKFTLEDAFEFVHQNWIQDRDPQMNKGGWWEMQLDNRGNPEFFAFSPPRRPMNDGELEEHKSMLRRAKVTLPSYEEQRPFVFDWPSLEGSYELPKGRIGGIHIVATDRHAWMK
jgi:hypothetical protein